MTGQVGMDSKHDHKRQKMIYGGQLMGGIAAASFAAILTLVALNLPGGTAEAALIAFCFAMPIATAHRFMTSDPVRRYKLSWLQAIVTLICVFSFITGLVLMLWPASITAACVLGFLAFLMVFWVGNAEEQGEKAAKAKETSDITSPQTRT